MELLQSMLYANTGQLGACGKIKICELRAVVDKLLNTSIGDHLAVFERNVLQFLAMTSERLQVLVCEVVT